jgi:hypothetical protein
MGQNPSMPEVGGGLQHDAVVKELKLVRERSLAALRRLRLPVLHQAASSAGLTTAEGQPEPAAIEDLIRKAVDRFEGGPYQEAAQYTFGLIGGTKYELAAERRRQAAKACNISSETFRKSHEKVVIEQTAEGVLALARDAAMRRANLQMQKRHPADSRLAVAWVERFEAYYRVWTPVYALAADLRAALHMYNEAPADHLPWDEESDNLFDPVKEAQGYARSALYRYGCFLLEMKRFLARHGGLWLFSDAQRESDIRDAVYRIGWHNPLNEENDSWLRRQVATSLLEEAEQFYIRLKSSNTGDQIHRTWQRFVRDGASAALGHGRPQQVQLTIEACEEYTSWVDEDWMRICDWYAVDAQARPGVNASALYADIVGVARPVNQS